ncbi:MAG: (2Fe-2S)-binding protein [Peptococcaceae bacterium]
MNKLAINFTLNGKEFAIDVEPQLLLVDLLREKLDLTGTKIGCGEGDCGACTVLMDGKPVNSCLVLAAKVNGHKITTVEGLGTPAALHPLQKSFIEEGAVQCGFCTPGMLMSAKSLLDTNKNPSSEEIKECISGNLCRCTGYSKIVKAIEKASRDDQEGCRHG